VLGSCSQSELVSVEGGHVWLNVIEKECLDQVGSMNFQGHFLKEILNVQLAILNLLKDQSIGRLLLELVVQLKSFDGSLGKSETHEWVQSVVALGNVIDDHHGVSESTILINKGLQIAKGEGEALLAAHVEPRNEADIEARDKTLILIIGFLLLVRSNLNMSFGYLEILLINFF
jgi:hypothetical protein